MVKRARVVMVTAGCLWVSAACGRIGFSLDPVQGTGGTGNTGGGAGAGGFTSDSSADAAGAGGTGEAEAGAVCGNGIVDAGEQCDDTTESAGCDADCSYAACGDGYVNAAAGEDCDLSGGQDARCGTSGGCGPDCKFVPAGAATFDGGTCTCDRRRGHRYSYCVTGQTFAASEAACASIGGHLVRLDDTAEAAWARHGASWSSFANEWIGATLDGVDWAWTDGTVFWSAGAPAGGLYSNWADNLPLASLGGCTFFSFDGTMRNTNCSETRPFTCETYRTPPATCGDGNVDPGEACDDGSDSATCDADCTLSLCGDGYLNAPAGETCDGGGSDPDCPVNCQKAPRVIGSLVALYELEEGSGTTITDTSNVGPPMNLTIGAPQNATWVTGGGLSITGPAQIHTAGPATKLIASCTASNALTVEIWLQTANHTDTGRSIIALSVSPTDRAFRLSHEGRDFTMRVRTTSTTADGSPTIQPAGLNSGTLVRLAYMLSGGPEERFFFDEVELGPPITRTSQFSQWPTNAELWVGDEAGAASADFHGTIRSIAIYSRPLSLAEVTTNYLVGP